MGYCRCAQYFSPLLIRRLGERYNDGRNEAQQPIVKLDVVRQNNGPEVRCFKKYFMVFLSVVNTD
ncbi:hypothetical protein GCM10009128_04950 [Psychrosphaera haliotis]